MKKIKYLTKKLLREINDASIREERNRAIREECVDEFPDDRKFPVIYHMYHTRDEIRLLIKLGDGDNEVGFIDVSTARYNTLPNAIFHDDGRVELEDLSVAEAKRPYPNGREWKEKVVRQPVRKQPAFRKGLLQAYEFQCAMCTINEPSLLRGAHIVDVADGGDDSIQNGICLCSNHERAFDKGIIEVTEDFSVRFRRDCNIPTFDRLRLPKNERERPSKKNIIIKQNKFKQKS